MSLTLMLTYPFMQRAGVPYFGWRAENALDTSAKRDRP